MKIVHGGQNKFVYLVERSFSCQFFARVHRRLKYENDNVCMCMCVRVYTCHTSFHLHITTARRWWWMKLLYENFMHRSVIDGEVPMAIARPKMVFPKI